MIFLANPTIANDWLSVAAATREIFDLRSATVFAAAFFAPIARVCRATA